MQANYFPEIALAIEDVLGVPVDALTADVSFQDDVNLDSMMFVQFLVALEDRIPAFRFDDQELDFDAYKNVGSLSDCIVARVAMTEAA